MLRLFDAIGVQAQRLVTTPRQLYHMFESCILPPQRKQVPAAAPSKFYPKEDYYIVKVLLEALQYSQYNWEITGDFKMVDFLLGLQGSFIKFQCFLCICNS